MHLHGVSYGLSYTVSPQKDFIQTRPPLGGGSTQQAAAGSTEIKFGLSPTKTGWTRIFRRKAPRLFFEKEVKKGGGGGVEIIRSQSDLAFSGTRRAQPALCVPAAAEAGGAAKAARKPKSPTKARRSTAPDAGPTAPPPTAGGSPTKAANGGAPAGCERGQRG